MDFVNSVISMQTLQKEDFQMCMVNTQHSSQSARSASQLQSFQYIASGS